MRYTKYVIKKSIYGKIPLGIVTSGGVKGYFENKSDAEKYLIEMNTKPNQTSPLFEFKVEPVEVDVLN